MPHARLLEGLRNVSAREAIFIAILTLLAGVFVVCGFLLRSSLGVEGKQRLKSVVVVIGAEDTRRDVVTAVGNALDWPQQTRAEFFFALRSIQWDAFNEPLADFLSEEFNWNAQHREVFLTRANDLLNSEGDILANAFVPQEYTFTKDNRPAFIAEALVDAASVKYGGNLGTFFEQNISVTAQNNANALARAGMPEPSKPEGTHSTTSTAEMRFPDLIPLPPQDLALRQEGNQTRLVFSTTYYNVGKGTLELIGDPETQGIREDHERDVLQRIYRTDDTYYTEVVGTFDWHQLHLHYHFADFVDYILEPLGAPTDTSLKKQQKSTYCIRDVTRIDVPDTPDVPAKYRICAKELQGVSIGWGDTYFQTYADQFFDVTELPSGTYRLSFHVNPAERLIEVDRSNNVSSTVFEFDKETGIVEVLRRYPEDAPGFEHVHIEQDL